MLEASQLLIQPAAGSPSRGSSTCLAWVIRDAARGCTLGGARRSSDRPAWLRWLRPAAIVVYETEDESLLCTIRRRWCPAPAWEVRDAEGRCVGRLRGSAILDHQGQPLARIETLPTDVSTWFLSHDRQPLGTARRNRTATTLAFATDRDIDPFAKMLLLAAVMVEDCCGAGRDRRAREGDGPRSPRPQ